MFEGKTVTDRSRLVRQAARVIVEEASEGEAADALGGRGHYEHGADRRGYRNGYRLGKVKSAEGEIEFAVPQVSDTAEPFRSKIREVIRGRTEELERLAVEMYARGLSVRDIEAAFTDEAGTLCSEQNGGLGAHRAAVGRLPGLCRRRSGRIQGVVPLRRRHRGEAALGAAAGSGACGLGHHRDGAQGAARLGARDEGRYSELPRFLERSEEPRARRSDSRHQRRCSRAHSRLRGGISESAAATLPGAQDPKPAEQGARGGLARAKRRGACGLPSRQSAGAQMLRKDFVARYERQYPSATACFLEDFDACIAHLRLPISHWRATPTTNMLERLFGEERRRTKVIPHAFGERPVFKLMYAALIRASETWKNVVIKQFELRQLEQLREHLNERHSERTAPVVKCASRSRISSKNGA